MYTDQIAKMPTQYGGDQLSGSAGLAQQPTMRQRLESQKARLTEQIKAIDDALTALDSTPDFENVMNAVAKAQIY